MQRFFYALILLSFCFVIGCGGKVIVKGTIKTKDGTLIENGTVIFRSDTEQYSADIQPGGTFSPGKFKDGDGIPPGVYKIGVMNVRPKGEALPSAATPVVPLRQGESSSKGLIHSKYGDAITSGLTLDTSKTNTLDLVLDPPE